MSGFLEYTTIFLFVTWIFTKLFAKTKHKNLIAVVCSLCIVFVPLGHLTIAQYILSLHPSFSFSSCAMSFILLFRQFTNKSLISAQETQCFLWWNVIFGTVLYLSSFALIPFDIYFYGFFFSAWFIFFSTLWLLA